MTRRVLILCFAASGWAAGQMPCPTVTGSYILGKDLARVVPAFQAVPAGVPIAPSPIPGAVRRFSVAELRTLASRFSISETAFDDVCFQIKTEPLNREHLIEAMMAALKVPDARIEILETSGETVPAGRIEFRRENLGLPANPYRSLPVIWRGDVIYAGDSRFSIWVKVRLTVIAKRLTAVENIRAGVAIKAGQVAEEAVESFPILAKPLRSLTELEGLVPVRSIAAGAEVRPDDVTRPSEVVRGDLVHVEVRMGAARLALTGRAESSGRVGDLVPVRNLESSRIFQARVEGKASVIVQLRGLEESLR